MGPPGTGKTTTIVEVVKRAIYQKQRVLITSKNNKAVDNVLEQLTDQDMEVLRIGRPEVTLNENLLIDMRAYDYQRKILKETDQQYTQLSKLDRNWVDVKTQLYRLQKQAGQWQGIKQHYEQAREQLQNWQQTTYGQYGPKLEVEQARAKQIRRKVDQLVKSADRLDKWMVRFNRWRRRWLLGPLSTVLIDIAHRRRQNTSDRYQKASSDFEKNIQTYQHTIKQYQQEATSSQEALKLKTVIAELEMGKNQAKTDTLNLYQPLYTRFIQAALINKKPITDTVTPAGVIDFITKARMGKDFIKPSLDLLEEWRELLRSRYQALYPTLIRLADVIGATCIGIGTDVRFDDLEFDMVIADEAGQIQVMDLLVPLVRAKRAILVGDHKQLPPFADTDLKQELDDDETLLELVESSLFEQLFEATPHTNKVTLDTQYRMPEVIANFVKRQFYEGRYKTCKDFSYNDAVFNHPLVFIDTKLASQHWEKTIPREDESTSFTNLFEADLIVRLIQLYLPHLDENVDQNLGVIVPYKAQAEIIHRMIRRQLPSFSDKTLKELVATVDSFQGKERHIIIFGFTRSNSDGRTGFLRELRRLNVTFTRAKTQLILVGDSSTLTNSENKGLRNLCKELVIYVQQYGEYLTIDQFKDCYP